MGDTYDLVVTDARLATMVPAPGDPYGLVEQGAVAIREGTIAWVGPAADLPDHELAPGDIWSAGGRLVTPGLVDCHTHIVFGGHRAAEFEQRLGGASYEEIARAGGGILSTVRATRAASLDDLVDAARGRLAQLAAGGVTTVEVKSGYGLTTDHELTMLRAARELGRTLPVDVQVTFLGAHTIPPEYRDNPDAYVDLVCDEMLPAVAVQHLADAVDAFCERIAFSPRQVERIFDRAHQLGLPVKLHADQLSDGGGAALAARFAALSADHLEHASSDGLAALAAAGTVAVLLPGATYFLRESARPPVDELRRLGVPMAVATDANPGTAPLLSLTLAANQACVVLGLTPAEALAGITRNAAAALGLEGRAGVLARGAAADLVAWDAEQPVELVYWMGRNLAHTICFRGNLRGPTDPLFSSR